MNTFSKTTQHFQNALRDAYLIALELRHGQVKPEHLLFGLSKQKGSIAYEILGKMSAHSDEIKQKIIVKNKRERRKELDPYDLKMSKTSQKIIKKAFVLAYEHKHQYVGTEHVLAAMTEAWKRLDTFVPLGKSHGNKMQQHLQSVLKSTSKFPDLTSNFNDMQDAGTSTILEGDEKPQQSALEYFGVELTSGKQQEKIDPVIGRENEIDRLVQILSRRYKNNPLLIGEPGVGKTAVVEGLAKRIYEGNVPDILHGKRIISLDMSAMVAGSIYRGEFESRVKQVLDEVKNQDDIIIFIDEIHNIVGAGSVNGSMDASNMFKPALARGEIRCIGATTHDEFQKHVQQDKALARRFQNIYVEEPSREYTQKILMESKQYYEKFHSIQIADSLIDSIIDLSTKYMPLKKMPDKALDLLDEAASRAKLAQPMPPELKEIKNLRKEHEIAITAKQQAVSQEKFDEAMYWKSEENELSKTLEMLKSKMTKKKQKFIGELTLQDIKNVIAQQTGVSPENLHDNTLENISTLHKRLEKNIKGQTQALEKIAGHIKRRKAFQTPEAKRPFASFIFVGPSGVGKTETAHALAETIFGDRNSVIRFDMSEFSEKFNISKLIGSPAGYVGYKESGMLAEQIQKKPHSVVLFDEIEKAHPDVFNILLQILDTGYLHDAAGRKMSLHNAIIILTSNIGTHKANKTRLGFNHADSNQTNELQKDIKKDLRQFLKVELLNRFDEVIFFNRLEHDDYEAIIKERIKSLANHSRKKGIALKVTQSAHKHLAKKSIDPVKGARNVDMIIQKLIEDKLADIIIESAINTPKTLTISTKNNELTWTKSR